MNYASGSNNFTLRRVFLEYWRSITFTPETDLSWRINSTSSLIRNSSILNTISEPLSTLIANVHGFHARANVLPGSTRYQLHFSLR